MDTRDLFIKITNHKPYDYQIRAWDRIKDIMNNGGKLIIEVPTAGGKTEAAIFPYLTQIINGNWKVPRLIYVLPTRSLVEKQAERIRKYLEHVLMLKGLPHKTSESMSKKMIQVEYGLEETHAFLGYIVLTTWDAFLYGLAAHRTVGNRFTFPAGAIAQSLLIFDEVQMYQDESLYMPRLMGLVIKKLEKANVPIVIMTATLPTKLKEMLRIDKRISILQEDKRKPERGEVKVEFKKELSWEDMKREIKETLKEGKKALIIRNTVPSAVKTYEKLKEDFKDVLLIHSRFSVGDRKKKEAKIDGAHIIVATQVVEAGLDLPNVGLVITDLAPLDALIQRIGRCARRKEETGKAIIILPHYTMELKENVVLSIDDLKTKVVGKQKPEKIVFNIISHKDYKRSVEVTLGIIKKNRIEYREYYATSFENLDRKFLKKSKKDLFVIPYNVAPYDPLIMLKSYDEVGNIEEYLLDIEKARDALDRVYDEYYRLNIVPKEYYLAYVYFRNLKLFSAPPEYELKSRPELYAMLYPHDSGKIELSEIEFNPLNVIRVNFSWLSSNWDKLEVEGELTQRTKGKPSKPEPYKIYVINAENYSKDTGIVLNEKKNKAKNMPEYPRTRKQLKLYSFTGGDAS